MAVQDVGPVHSTAPSTAHHDQGTITSWLHVHTGGKFICALSTGQQLAVRCSTSDNQGQHALAGPLHTT